MVLAITDESREDIVAAAGGTFGKNRARGFVIVHGTFFFTNAITRLHSRHGGVYAGRIVRFRLLKRYGFVNL